MATNVPIVARSAIAPESTLSRMSDPTCVFCKIVAGQMPAARIAETDHTLAFLDLVQPRPGHVLVVPKEHYRDLLAMQEELAAAVMRLTHRIAGAIAAALAPEGLSVVQWNGAAAGQEVMHMHVHLQPRAPGDGLLRYYGAGGPPPASSGDDLQALADQIRAGLAG